MPNPIARRLRIARDAASLRALSGRLIADSRRVVTDAKATQDIAEIVRQESQRLTQRLRNLRAIGSRSSTNGVLRRDPRAAAPERVGSGLGRGG